MVECGCFCRRGGIGIRACLRSTFPKGLRVRVSSSAHRAVIWLFFFVWLLFKQMFKWMSGEERRKKEGQEPKRGPSVPAQWEGTGVAQQSKNSNLCSLGRKSPSCSLARQTCQTTHAKKSVSQSGDARTIDARVIGPGGRGQKVATSLAMGPTSRRVQRVSPPRTFLKINPDKCQRFFVYTHC